MRSARTTLRGAASMARTPSPADMARGQYVAPMLEAVAALGLSARPATLVLGACAASTIAIGVGLRWLAEGACDLVLAGGFDAVSVLVAAGFEVLRATTSRLPPRPFRVDRDGMALGEGAALLALMPPASRASRSRAYVVRFRRVERRSAPHGTGPHGEGLASAARATQWPRLAYRPSTSSARTPRRPRSVTPRKRAPSTPCSAVRPPWSSTRSRRESGTRSEGPGPSRCSRASTRDGSAGTPAGSRWETDRWTRTPACISSQSRRQGRHRSRSSSRRRSAAPTQPWWSRA